MTTSSGRRFEVHQAIFIDDDGNYTEENVDALTPIGSPRRVANASGNDFTIGPDHTQAFITAEWQSGSPTLTLKGPNGLKVVARAGAPSTIAESGPGGSGVYLVRVSVPQSLLIFMPTPVAGPWSISTVGGSGVRVHVQSNRPLPALEITSPGGAKPIHASLLKPTQTVAGTLSDVGPGATVMLLAGRAPCPAASGGAVAYPGVLIARHLRVTNGTWRYAWNTAALQPGSYHLYAQLENGRGPLVSTCSAGTVSVERPSHPAAPRALNVTLKGSTLTVSWKPPAPTGTGLGYEIRWRAAKEHTGAWQSLTIGTTSSYVLNLPPVSGGYAIGVAAYDVSGHLGPVATTHTTGPSQPHSPAQKSKSVHALAALSRSLASTAVAAAGASDCSAPSGGHTKTVTVPIFMVTSSTPNIAYNDAAAISGTDPSDNTNAVWVQNGKYVHYPHHASALADLHYGRLSYSNGCVKLSKQHRAEACGKDPFKDGKKPGPPDGELDPKTGAKTNGMSTSCDEYPFASSKEGGSDAIIRGVPLAENSQQGRDLSRFLRENANTLMLLDGEFQVCVNIKGKEIGRCGKTPRVVKTP